MAIDPIVAFEIRVVRQSGEIIGVALDPSILDMNASECRIWAEPAIFNIQQELGINADVPADGPMREPTNADFPREDL